VNLGRKWYEDGKLLKKENTFTDFIDCSKYLISIYSPNIYMLKEALLEDY
jgi:protease II